MDWDKLRVFHAVAEAGSFTHAGETLNRTVREVFAKLAMTETLLTESKEKPTGRLKVTTTVAFGSTWLAPRLKDFLDHYPEITLSVVLDDAELDLAMREADVAIRMHPPRQPDLVQRHLLTISWVVYASEEYLAKHGTPQRIEDLAEHKLVLYGDYRPPVPDINWLADAGKRAGVTRKPALEMNSIFGMLRAVRSGLGIAALPDYMVEETEGLTRVLTEVKAPKVDAYFVYPEELRNSKRVAVFRDFLLARLADKG